VGRRKRVREGRIATNFEIYAVEEYAREYLISRGYTFFLDFNYDNAIDKAALEYTRDLE
jgi:hypothetical protein